MKYIVTLCLSLVFFASQAQEVVSSYETQDTFEAKSQKLTTYYDQELGLDADQRVLFQKKVEEYLILQQEAKDQLAGREELEKLYQLQLDEIRDMQDILTRIQWNKYKKIRPTKQALKITTDRQ